MVLAGVRSLNGIQISDLQMSRSVEEGTSAKRHRILSVICTRPFSFGRGAVFRRAPQPASPMIPTRLHGVLSDCFFKVDSLDEALSRRSRIWDDWTGERDKSFSSLPSTCVCGFSARMYIYVQHIPPRHPSHHHHHHHHHKSAVNPANCVPSPISVAGGKEFILQHVVPCIR